MSYFTFFSFLSKSQLLELFYVINTAGLMYILITCNSIYIYNQIAVYSVKGKVNLHIAPKDFVKYFLGIIDVKFFCLILIGANIPSINLKMNPLIKRNGRNFIL